jgi:hypothetical protein
MCIQGWILGTVKPHYSFHYLTFHTLFIILIHIKEANVSLMQFFLYNKFPQKIVSSDKMDLLYRTRTHLNVHMAVTLTHYLMLNHSTSFHNKCFVTAKT